MGSFTLRWHASVPAALRCGAAVTVLAALALTGCTSSGTTGAPATSSAASRPSSSAAASSSSPAAHSSGSRVARSSPTRHGTVQPGNIHRTVASHAVRTLAPKKLHGTASFGRGVTVKPVAIKSITAKAHGPGEIGGPAVEVVLRFHNAGSSRADLRTAVVDVMGSNGDPAPPITSSPTDPVRSFLAPHSSAEGTYVFTLAKSKRKPITISVATTASAPVVLFVGNAD